MRLYQTKTKNVAGSVAILQQTESTTTFLMRSLTRCSRETELYQILIATQHNPAQPSSYQWTILQKRTGICVILPLNLKPLMDTVYRAAFCFWQGVKRVTTTNCNANNDKMQRTIAFTPRRKMILLSICT